jgi:transposase
MPFVSSRAKLNLIDEERVWLQQVAQSRTESVSRVERAQILLRYSEGETVSGIADSLATNRPKVERCISKALEFGLEIALQDLPGRGRRASIPADAKNWVVNLACQKPKELGYAQELWTTRLLARHVRKHGPEAGYPSLAKLGPGTVSKILAAHLIRPHKIEYYLERRDAEFEAKMIQLLHVYKDVEVWRKKGLPQEVVAVLSYDEKPGIQAISNTAPDLPPRPGEYPAVGRDYEYKRHGTVSLLAGINLLDGHVLGFVRDRHRSREFVEFLKLADDHYPKGSRIRIVLDNHSAHTSKETRSYLATVPNRFEFIFTPKHGSWLNLVEIFFSKLARTLLRGIRVASKPELKIRIERYLQEVNDEPTVFKWKYKLETVSGSDLD